MTARDRSATAAIVALLTLGGATMAAPASADHGAAEATVIVDDNRFDPFRVNLEPGGTVTWDVREGPHTIVADDARFAFRGQTGAGLQPGDVRSFTFGETEERVGYHCTVHPGMRGEVIVGHPAVPPLGTVIDVPGEPGDLGYPRSIQDAVDGAPDGAKIRIAPGYYRVDEPIVVANDARLDGDELPAGITIEGTGDGPGEVVVGTAFHPNLGSPDSAFHVTGHGVTIANLSVDASNVGSTGAGVHLDGANQAELRDVVVGGGGWSRDGVRITDASGATLRRVEVDDVRRAGVRIETCAACGVLIEGAALSGGLVGVLASGARGVTVRGSAIRANTVGVVARRQDTRLTTISVYGNEITDNVERSPLPTDPRDPDRALASGAGIWLDGTADSLASRNFIAGNTFGVAVSGGARDVVVRDNSMVSNGTDLAWDGVGVNTCFAGHHANVVTSPPVLNELYPCGRPNAGVPYPLVNLALLLAAYA